MEDYILKSSISILVFYVSYRFVLRKTTYFKQNRLFLLIGLIISLTIPFLDFQFHETTNTEFFVTLDSIDVGTTYVSDTKNIFDNYSFIELFYFLIIVLLSFQFLFQFISLINLFFNSEKEKRNGYVLVLTNKNNANFSFFNYIFINKKTKNSEGFNAIIKHEFVHIVQKHSVDILLAEILTIVLWFNPFAWLYKKTIKENHEYLADDEVISKTHSTIEYQKLLFEQSFGVNFSIANNFNSSLTFKRLNMMKKIKSNKYLRFNILLTLPVIVFMIFFVACSKEIAQIKPNKEAKIVNTENIKKMSVISDNDTVFYIVDKMPEFPGGEVGLKKHIAENTIYPKQAIKTGTEGRVYVRFAVAKTGSVEHISVVRSIDKLLDEEAVRVVKTLPDWKPAEQDGEKVNVWYTVPINFTLNSDKKDNKTIVENADSNIKKQDFYIVENMPQFPGKELGLRKFIAKNIIYPKDAREKNIKGKVYVRFLVTENGLIDKVSIAKGVDKTIDNEAMRVIKLTSGKWTPGEQKGEKVNVWYTIPINFALK